MGCDSSGVDPPTKDRIRYPCQPRRPERERVHVREQSRIAGSSVMASTAAMIIEKFLV